MRLLNWLNGKKTYICAAIAGAIAFSDAMGWGPIPEWIYVALAGAGLYSVRKAIGNGTSGRAGIVLACLLVPAALLAGTAGCSLLSTGRDVRTATEAISRTVWDANSNLSIDESTTHDRRTVAAEGTDVSADYYPDGTPRTIVGAQVLLSQVSEPANAADAYNRTIQANLAFGTEVLATLRSMMPMLRGDTAGVGVEVGVDAGGIERRARDWWNALSPEQRDFYEQLWRQYAVPQGSNRGSGLRRGGSTTRPATRPAVRPSTRRSATRRVRARDREFRMPPALRLAAVD